MKDLRVELHFKNAILISAIEETFGQSLRKSAYRENKGIIRKAAHIIGVPYEWIQSVIRLQKDPRYGPRQGSGSSALNGQFKPNAILIAEALCRSPEELFPESLYADKFKRKWVADTESVSLLSLSTSEVQLLTTGDETDRQAISERNEIIQEIMLAKLEPKERQVIEMRFGFDGYERTQEQIGQELKLSRNRIYQIERTALRKLRHPSAIRWLRNLG